MKVFISYRRDDTAGHAGRLSDSLQSHFGADNVFMDLSDIDSGQNFVDVIDTAVRSSDVLLAVIGKQWLTCTTAGTRRLDMPSDFVRTEIGVALEHGVPVIPRAREGAGMPLVPSLPEQLKPLAAHDAHDLSDERWSYDVGRLIEATEKLAGKRPLQRWPVTGGDQVPVEHHYRGMVTGNTIAFTMQSEGGSSTVPVDFTASRNRPVLQNDVPAVT